eukprot:GHVL01019188.1.p1 GENE.GHVL01019188.1~~GHVL01019188.1.p1  ORF type:complete len:506 (+),score=58.81 GHVL01019188.1:40-1557(+)
MTKQTENYDASSKHVGQLNASQSESLLDLKRRLGDSIKHPRYNDVFLLRFLRARKFDVDKTETMIRKNLDWRESIDLDNIGEIYTTEQLAKIKRMYPHGYYGTDKMGRPVYIERLGKIEVGHLLEATDLESFLLYYVQEYERLLELRMPACSVAMGGKPIHDSLTILDLQGLGMKHFSNSCQKIIKRLTSCCQENYPETLGQMFIINAPKIFSAIWPAVKSWIDPKTASKIKIVSSISALKKETVDVIDIDTLPCFIGGGQIDDYEWLTNEIGPWMNPVIVRQTLALYPHISRSLVYPHVLLKCDELDQKENEKKNEIQVKKEISEKKGIQQIEIQEIKVKERSKILDEKEANPSQHIDPRQENVRDVKRVSSAETMSTVCKTITPQTKNNKTITPQSPGVIKGAPESCPHYSTSETLECEKPAMVEHSFAIDSASPVVNSNQITPPHKKKQRQASLQDVASASPVSLTVDESFQEPATHKEDGIVVEGSVVRSGCCTSSTCTIF